MNIDNEKLKQAAYAMVKSYDENGNMGDAIHTISNDFPELKDGILRGMWMAIDAYMDIGRRT